MDYFAHALWSYVFFNKTKKPIYAMLFGIVPDSFSWLIFFIYSIFVQGGMGRPSIETLPQWPLTLYSISHSLVTAAVVFGVVYLIMRRIPIYMWAWPIHILIDMPTHSRAFLPTPFLWPISSWTFPGFSWGVRWFMILNWSALLISLGYIFYKKRIAKKSQQNDSAHT